MLDHHSHWDIAAMILDSDRVDIASLRITFSKLVHTPVLGDQFRVAGTEATRVIEMAAILKKSKPVAGADDGVDWEHGLLPAVFSQPSASASDNIGGDAAAPEPGERKHSVVLYSKP